MEPKKIYYPKQISGRFTKFISKLGSLIKIKDASPSCYVGEFPKDGSEYAYGLLWRNELTQIFFSVNTLMKYKEIDGNTECISDVDYV